MRIGVPGEFHEERWQRTAEDSERCMLPRTREEGPIGYKLSRGEGKEIGAVDGIKVGFRTGFGTAPMPTSTPEAFRRG